MTTAAEKERARYLVEQFVARFEPSYLFLAYHAALPLVLTPELVGYLRTRFLRGQAPWVAEADLLLNLCRPVGYEQYAMETAVRAHLLSEMEAHPQFGPARMQEVARLLIQYTRHLARANPYLSQFELRAQQWSAMSYLEKYQETIINEISSEFQSLLTSSDAIYGLPQINKNALQALCNITQKLAPQLKTYPEFIDYASNVSLILNAPDENSSAGKLSDGEIERLKSIFPQYAQPTQEDQEKTVQRAQREFALSGDASSLTSVVLSMLFTAVKTWIEQQNRQTLSELELQQEADRTQLAHLLDDTLKGYSITKRERERLRPYLAEAIAKEIGDPYSSYEQGLKKLIEQVGINLELLTYESQLRKNISLTRQYGDTAERRVRRNEIIEQLNIFSLQTLGQSFNELSLPDHKVRTVLQHTFKRKTSGKMPETLDLPDHQEPFVESITQIIIEQVAPQEMPVFKGLIAMYFADTTSPDLSATPQHDPLSMGLGVVTPAATAVVVHTLTYLFQQYSASSQEWPEQQKEWQQLFDWEVGLQQLLKRIPSQHVRHLKLLTFQAQLTENMQQVRFYGDADELRVNRFRVIEQLNHLALDTVGEPFDVLCNTGNKVGPAKWQKLYDEGFRIAQTFGVTEEIAEDIINVTMTAILTALWGKSSEEKESKVVLNEALIIDNRMEQPLPSHIKEILKTMFAVYGRVIVKHEFSAGFSGSRVFMVRPIREDGSAELPSVVKVDDYDRIGKEWQAYQNCIHNRLPSVAKISGTPVYPPGSQHGGLRYPLAGDGAFDVQSLLDYCQQASIDDIGYVLERLFKSLEKLWEQKRVQPKLHLHTAYDSFLHPNLLIEHTAVPTGAKTHWLRPETIQQQTQPFEVGDAVQLSDFQVVRVLRKSQAVVLDIPSHLPGAYRLQYQSVPDIAAYEVGQIVHHPLTGRVTQTRQGALLEQAKEILGSGVDLTAVSLPLPNNDPLPNPLVALPKLLNQSFDAYTACIHGDLHLGNVLVEPESGNIHLIDFVNTREDHVLRDFLNLELDIVNRLMPADLSGPKQIISFYERLHRALRYPEKTAPPTRLEKSFAMLLSVRQAAQKYLFKRDEWREYYSGLVVYLLGSLRHSNLDGIAGSKQVAFWGATAVLKLLETGMSYDELLNSRDAHAHSSISSPRPSIKPARETTPRYRDKFSLHEIGIQHLLTQIGRNHPHYLEALSYQERLRDNIGSSRRFGDTSLRKADRAEIIEQLNELSLSVLGISFNELCQGAG